ncbi:hypothetical protein ACJX0J_036889, partial [Zea mays]
VLEVIHLDHANVSKAELKERLAKMYKVKDPNTIFVFKFRTSSTGSGLIYDNLYSKKFEPKYCLMRRKFAQWRKRFKSMDLHPTKPWLFTLFVQKESVLDREDAYLAQVVFEHMQLDDNEVVLGGGQDAMNVTMIDCRVGKFEAKFYHKARAMTPESEVKCHATVFSGWFTERPSRWYASRLFVFKYGIGLIIIAIFVLKLTYVKEKSLGLLTQNFVKLFLTME